MFRWQAIVTLIYNFARTGTLNSGEVSFAELKSIKLFTMGVSVRKIILCSIYTFNGKNSITHSMSVKWKSALCNLIGKGVVKGAQVASNDVMGKALVIIGYFCTCSEVK